MIVVVERTLSSGARAHTLHTHRDTDTVGVAFFSRRFGSARSRMERISSHCVADVSLGIPQRGASQPAAPPPPPWRPLYSSRCPNLRYEVFMKFTSSAHYRRLGRQQPRGVAPLPRCPAPPSARRNTRAQLCVQPRTSTVHVRVCVCWRLKPQPHKRTHSLRAAPPLCRQTRLKHWDEWYVFQRHRRGG